MVDKDNSKLIEIIEKLFNTKSNEYIVKLFNYEVMIPAKPIVNKY